MVSHQSFGEVGRDPILMCHGLASHRGTWTACAERFAKTHHVITFDMRGHGASPSPPGEWTIEDLSRDVLELLDELRVDRAHFIGHSAGGVTALHFALTYPDRVRALVLSGAASHANQRARDWYCMLADQAEREGAASIRSSFGIEEAGPLPDASGFARASRAMSTLHAKPLTPRLGELRCPTLILAGEKDFLGPRAPVILHEGIAGSKLVVIPGAGHGLHLEVPEAFDREVREFLQCS